MPVSPAACRLLRFLLALGLVLGGCARRVETGPRSSASAESDAYYDIATRCREGADLNPSLFPAGAFGHTRDHHLNLYPFDAEDDARTRCEFSAHLRLMGEGSLLRSPRGAEVYRFLWLRAFYPPVAVRIERRNGMTSLVARRTEGAAGRSGTRSFDRTRSLSSAQWEEFLRLLEAARFWNPPVSPGEPPFVYADASVWVLEGVRDGRHRVMEVLVPQEESPSAAYRAACVYLLSLSGIPLPSDEIY